MAQATSADARWRQLTSTRSSLIRRCERYASYTLPKICPPEHYHQEKQELSQDFQAVGAQSVNHLANKIMLALFAPSRPFFRLDATPAAQAEIDEAEVPEDVVASALAKAETAAVKQLDKRALRPKLYEAVKHLIITGNVLVCLEEAMRVVGIKRFAVRRSLSGELLELMIADAVVFDELDEAVQAHVTHAASKQPDDNVTLYRWITRSGGEFNMTQWVDSTQLPKAFDGKYPEDKLPYRVLTWDLADGQHYGTGLVEDYGRDFAGLSALSLAQVQGAILASEFRWLVNPAGMTKVEDFEQSANGAALPGQEGDVVLVQSGKSADLQVTMNMSAEYVNRIGRGFLLGSQLVRDAERVTAEEIRMVANELETALGGAYSRLAVDFQTPLARWLLTDIKVDLRGFEPTIITGLDALSRTGDLEELKLWLADCALLGSLPEGLQARLRLDQISSALGTPRRIDVTKYLKTEQELAAEQQQARAQQAEMTGTEAGIKAAVNTKDTNTQ